MSEDVSEVSRQKVEQVVAVPASDTATEVGICKMHYS